MAPKFETIDFGIIEDHKENIAALPSGRSAKALARLYSPADDTNSSSTRDLQIAARRDFESEIAAIDNSDDPLDVYDRYIRWTLDTYPSTSATKESQLLPLLERATKAFLEDDQYKNDARYLKIWLTYIRLFSDAPRETFAYLARHEVGPSLALYYEEFAALLERDGRWRQAEEIYQLGLGRRARPGERLAKRFQEFKRRAECRVLDAQEPSSPAISTVRSALSSKKASPALPLSRAAGQQASSQDRHGNSTPRKSKIQVFSDDKHEGSIAAMGARVVGWDNLGSIEERKKENSRAPQPWTEEKLGPISLQKAPTTKMAVFKDVVSRIPQCQKHSKVVYSR